MPEKSSNINLYRTGYIDEYCCKFNEILDFAEYCLSLPDMNGYSSEHLDLLDRTFRIILESKDNQFCCA